MPTLGKLLLWLFLWPILVPIRLWRWSTVGRGLAAIWVVFGIIAIVVAARPPTVDRKTTSERNIQPAPTWTNTPAPVVEPTQVFTDNPAPVPTAPPTDTPAPALVAATAAPADAGCPGGCLTEQPGCVIKGNINRREKIYHVPAGQSYDATEIDPGQGERWFCTEEEARAAGWRKSQR